MWWATDPDFLTLYSRFFTEIDIVIALAIGLLYKKFPVNVKNLSFYFVILLFTIASFLFGWRIFNLVDFPKANLIVEREISKWLQAHVLPTDRVYLSGSTAFWLNWFAAELSQVRGGIDQAATHPFWAQASFNLREGENPQTALAWLKAFRVKYIVVHDKNSTEYYGDFKNPEKFEGIGTQVFNNGVGDRIYKVEAPVLAQITSKQILELPKPKNGADLVNLSQYVAFLNQGVEAEVDWVSPSKFKVKAAKLNQNEGISLGITYDPAWNSECRMQNASCKIKIRKDPIGNLFLGSSTELQNAEIELKHGPRWDNWVGYVISIVTLVLVWRIEIAEKLSAKLPKFHFGLEEKS